MRRLVGLVAGAAAVIASPAAAALPSKARVAVLAGEAMHATGAKGLAIAVIDNGRVVSVQALGARNANGDPLTTDTVNVWRVADQGSVRFLCADAGR